MLDPEKRKADYSSIHDDKLSGAEQRLRENDEGFTPCGVSVEFQPGFGLKQEGVRQFSLLAGGWSGEG